MYFETQKLSVGYHRRPLIEDIDIGIWQGGILCLIGPNGSGKSTILRSITRHLTKLGGVVAIGGRDLDGMSDKELARHVSVVLTDRIEPELMTCWEVVAAGRYPYTNHFGKLSREDQRIVEDSMARVNALELREQRFTELSDGQKQRVLLARALCQQPEVIVLDEPTSYLSSILSACVTAFAGPISFVGIAVPHITRLIFRTSRPMVLIPATFLTGSVFCLACDLIARTAFSPTELTISTVTSVLGAPVVIWLMIKRRRNG